MLPLLGVGAQVGSVSVGDTDVLGRRIQPVEPDERLMDLVGLEPVGAELAFELVQLGAGIAAPVVFVNEHQHVKHEPNIAENPAASPALRGAVLRAGVAQPLAMRWNTPPGSRADGAREFQFKEQDLQLRGRHAGARDQGIQAHGFEAERVKQRVFRPGTRVRVPGAVRSRAGAKASRSSSTSSALSTSFAPCRSNAWHPRACGAWMEPGMAKTSLPCSAARRAVMSEPDCSAASTTSVPWLRPEMMRLRRESSPPGAACRAGIR